MSALPDPIVLVHARKMEREIFRAKSAQPLPVGFASFNMSDVQGYRAGGRSVNVKSL